MASYWSRPPKLRDIGSIHQRLSVLAEFTHTQVLHWMLGITTEYACTHSHTLSHTQCTIVVTYTYPVHTHIQHVLISWLLKLACACLSFDFIGTTTDESADDLATVQIPTSWRPTFLDCTTLQLFFNLFHSLTASLAAMVS